MQILTTEIRDGAQYFLDGATEAGELSSSVVMTLELYGDREAISKAVELPATPRTPEAVRAAIEELDRGVRRRHEDWRALRRVACDRLTEMAEEIMAQLPGPRRAALFALGALHLRYQIDQHANYLAQSFHEDMTHGGCQWEFRRRVRVHPKTRAPTKRVQRRLDSAKVIRRVVKTYSIETQALRRTAQHFFEGRGKALFNLAAPEIMAEIDALQNDRIRQRDEFRRLRPHRDPATGQPFTIVRKRDVRANRKIVRKAAVIAAGLLGASTVSAFARGEPITLPSKDCSLIVERRGQLHAEGHGQLSVTVAAPNGDKLADLCVYIRDTPALDQLSAFALYAQAGEVAQIIDTANVIQTFPAGIDHPVMAAKRRVEHRPGVEPTDGQGNLDLQEIFVEAFGGGWEADRRRRDEYWAVRGHVWRDALAAYVFGRFTKPMAILGKAQGVAAPC